MIKIQKDISVTMLLLFMLSCTGPSFVRNREARDDEQTYQKAVQMHDRIINKLTASVETQPVRAVSPEDDAADDPAIWYNKMDPARSVVFGSNKKAGIHVYDLKGNELQFLPAGKINNIDVRQGIKRGEDFVDVLAGSNRSDRSISIYLIENNGSIDPAKCYTIGLDNFKPYGFCLYKDDDQSLYAFVNNKKGEILQFSVSFDANGIQSELLRKIKVKTQPEGMVVDDDAHVLYIGEEQTGIHKISARTTGGTKTQLLAESTAATNEFISYDIEGLALFTKAGKKYLLASIQGSFSYAIFDLHEDRYVASFTIGGGSIDAVEETDGLEILQVNLKGEWNDGILIVQDGFNFDGQQKKNQNFKYVPLTGVLDLVK